MKKTVSPPQLNLPKIWYHSEPNVLQDIFEILQKIIPSIKYEKISSYAYKYGAIYYIEKDETFKNLKREHIEKRKKWQEEWAHAIKNWKK